MGREEHLSALQHAAIQLECSSHGTHGRVYVKPVHPCRGTSKITATLIVTAVLHDGWCDHELIAILFPGDEDDGARACPCAYVPMHENPTPVARNGG